MRDIRFRAWDNKEEWMVDDMLLSFDGEILTDDVQPHDTPYKEIELADEGRYELMQYTGMKDVKGVEIYEGDILKAIVSFDNVRRTLKLNMEVYDINHMFDIDRDFDRYEVIGNIYENMELLED